MEYKVYTNEEVMNWTDAPKEFLSAKQLKEAFDNNDFSRWNFECLISLDYIADAFHPELEMDVRTVKIIDIQGYENWHDEYIDNDLVNVVFKIRKRLPEMENKWDIYSKPYIKRFNTIRLFDMDSLDARWRLLMALNPPMFMQHLDSRIIIKPDNLQPQWWQEWKMTDKDYDFSQNKYNNGLII